MRHSKERAFLKRVEIRERATARRDTGDSSSITADAHSFRSRLGLSEIGEYLGEEQLRAESARSGLFDFVFAFCVPAASVTGNSSLTAARSTSRLNEESEIAIPTMRR